MRAAWAGLLLLAGCGEPAAAPRNESPPPAASPVENKAIQALPADRAAPAERPDPSALAGLSPRQRRAYEKGYADCRAGRYEPDPWPEAYRIGCAAANDR